MLPSMLVSAVALSLFVGSGTPSVESRFEWIVPDAGCPSAQQVRDDVGHMLATPGDAGEEFVRVQALVTRVDVSTWALELSIATSRGRTETRLRASTCATLAEATALFVALAVDPHGAVEHVPISTTPTRDVTEGDEGTSTPTEAPSDVPAGQSIAPAAAEMREGSGLRVRVGTRDRMAARDGRGARNSQGQQNGAREGERSAARERPLQWRLRVVGIGGFGVLPSVRGALGGGLALVTRHVRVDVEGAYWFRRRTPIEDAPGARTVTTTGVAAVRGCPFGQIRGFELGGCLGIELGRTTVGSEGLLDPVPARVLSLNLTGAFLVGWHPIDRLMIALEPGVVLALHRPRFAAVGVGDILQTGLVGGRLGLALEVALGDVSVTKRPPTGRSR